MSVIIDRRDRAGKSTGKKSTVNRQRFLRRYKHIIKKAVQESVNQRSITDIDHGDDIHIPRKDLSEPVFQHGQGGKKQQVHPGNKAFHKGDRFSRPSGGGGQGAGEGAASDHGSGVDEFVFQISREEFLEYVFEDLELPNMLRKSLKSTTEYSLRRGGFTSTGSPERINVVRSLRAAYARRIALSAKKKKKLKNLQAELALLQDDIDENGNEADQKKRIELEQNIQALQNAIKQLPFIDEFDLKYNNLIKVPMPSSKAVMFCIMDVSGSMGQGIKDIAKRFFMLLYLFLQRSYESVEVVFIRHHSEARECDEDEFFYARETGGTLVSKAMDLTSNIINERYSPLEWNIYIAQASDGDNWDNDCDICRRIIAEKLLPNVQYFAYVEIAESPQNLWQTYRQIQDEFADYFAQQRIRNHGDIYPVFRRLFVRRTG